MVKIAASILSADFARLGEQVEALERDGKVDRIHVDVMDGMFVPNITLGPAVVEAIRRHTALPLEVHLMVEAPHRYLQVFADAGANALTVHYEACPHIHRDVQSIHDLGLRAGVALNPGTAAGSLDAVLGYVDLVLLMTVDPGFGAQAFVPGVLRSVSKVRGWLTERGLVADLEVDGGVNASTARSVCEAGADVLVVGSALFRHPRGIAAAVAELRRSVEERT